MLPFNPNELKPDYLAYISNTELPILSQDQIQKLIRARTNIAELNGYCVAMPNPMLVLSPAVLKESLASSEIENIHTTLVDALQNSLFPDIERSQPDKEVLRYREAVMWAFEQIKKGLPLTSRIITGVQNLLIPSSHQGFRKNQNIIWNPSTKKVLVVPPKALDIPEFIKDWEIFVNDEKYKNIDPLIKIALSHYQFECIHPFDDGNGRTGRILMVLELIQEDLLILPILYLSGYIAKNKERYYQTLLSVRETNNWDDYLDFMLDVFALQAEETKNVFIKVISLFEHMKNKIQLTEPKIYSRELLEALFVSPVVSPVSLANTLGIHYTTASRHLKKLEKAGFLFHKKLGKNQLYINYKLIELLS